MKLCTQKDGCVQTRARRPHEFHCRIHTKATPHLRPADGSISNKIYHDRAACAVCHANVARAATTSHRTIAHVFVVGVDVPHIITRIATTTPISLTGSLLFQSHNFPQSPLPSILAPVILPITTPVITLVVIVALGWPCPRWILSNVCKG
jgi:hypothetical protein